MRETPDIETSSADYASRFSGSAGRYLLSVQEMTVRRAIEDLPAGSVLDVGGAHGQLVPVFAKLGWNVTVQGSDRSCELNLRDLHGRRECEFVASDLFALPFPDRAFDLVIAVRLISHVDDWRRLIGEMCRVSARTVMIDYPSKSALNVLTPLMFRFKRSLERNTRTYTSFSRRDIERCLAANGFRVVREHKQFFLPMVVHRVARGALPLRWAERLLRSLGLTALAGSPSILRAERCAGEGV